MSKLRGGKGGDNAGTVGQVIEADGGDGYQPVQVLRRDAGGLEQIAEVLERNVLAGRGGAADGGAYVAYKHDGKGVDAEMHEAANYVLKAGDSADNTAEAGGAADSDQGHDRHGDGAGEERLDIHGLLLDNGEENIADYYAAAEGHFGGQLYNVEHNNDNDHGDEAGPDGASHFQRWALRESPC